jgi:Na+/proline symporter
MSVDFFDYAMIVVYFGFMLAIGVIFRNTSKDTSDYLRGGGSMTWWMTGASSFMITFSAWTFVGCAGKIYATGTLIISLFVFNAVVNVFIGLFLAHRFRRMRVITPVEAVRRRFGFATEQVYAWQSSIIAFLFGGIALYTLAIFIAPILNLSLATTVLLVGGAITFMSVTGGAWAVVASDFVQMLVIMTITIVAAVLVLNMPEVGGVTGLIERMPSYHLDWTELMRPQVIGLWLVAIFLNQLASAINLIAGASRYLYVKSDRDAKRAAYMVAAGFVIGPILWFIPPIAASFVIPDIQAMFPTLANPEEAAYAAICMMVFPSGMLGLLVCGIFAATMSAMDSGLNRNSGILVRNIYKPLLRPQADEKELLWMAKGTTLVLGISMTLIGMWFSKVNELPMFDWTLLMAGLISIPMIMPVILGLFVRKTPGWSAWSTILVCFATAYVAKFHIDADWLAGVFGVAGPLSDQEAADTEFAAMVIGVSVIGTAWFLGSRWFYRREAEPKSADIDGFFEDLDTPVHADSAEHKHTDALQYRTLGLLCLAYGGFITLGTLIPNDFTGRLCFVFVGAVLCGVGYGLYRVYLRHRKTATARSDTVEPD